MFLSDFCECYAFFCFNFSKKEARHLQLQIDQITAKDIQAFGLQDRLRPNKSRTPKSKARRSPYPHITENPEYMGDYQDKDFDGDLDLVSPIQGFQGIGLPAPIITHANETLDRYSVMCSPYQGSPTDYKDFKDCAYPYLTPGHFDTGQLRHDNRYSLRDQQYHVLSNSGDNPKLNETLQLTPVTRDFRPNGQCSRSSSRDPSFGTPLSHHGPFSNRSDSSVSDVDVVDEYEGRTMKTTDSKQSDSSLEHNTNATDSEHLQTGSISQTENAQQSVIMRMSTSHIFNSSSPRYSCDFNQSKLPKSPCAAQTELAKAPFNPQNNTSPYFYETNPLDSSNKYLEIKPVPGKGLSCNDDALLQCLQNGYPYSSFSQGNGFSSPALHNKYPVLPQAGYTSVIVDAQQYMSNNFVH